MIAVIYEASSGRIIQTVESAKENILADGRPFVEVTERGDYDRTHRVLDGELMLLPLGGVL